MNLSLLTSTGRKPWLTINCESVTAETLDIADVKVDTVDATTINAVTVNTTTSNTTVGNATTSNATIGNVTTCNTTTTNAALVNTNSANIDLIAPRTGGNTTITNPRIGIPGFEYFMPNSIQAITAGETLYLNTLTQGLEFQAPIHGTFYYTNTASTTTFTFPLLNTWADLAGPIGFTAYSLRGMDQTTPFTFRNNTARTRTCMVTFSLTHFLNVVGPAPTAQLCELSLDLNGIPIPQKTAESASTTVGRCTGMSVIISVPAGGTMNLIAQNTISNRGLDITNAVVAINSID